MEAVMSKKTFIISVSIILIFLLSASGCGEKNEYIKELKSKGIEVTQDRFMSAVLSGESSTVELFLQAWAENDETMAELANTDIVTTAIANEHFEIASLLIDAGFSATLMEAVQARNRQKVEALINNGADINVHNQNGASALVWASAFGDVEIVELLLDAGAEPDEASFNNAEAGNHPAVLKALSKVIIAQDLDFIFSEELINQPMPIATSAYPKTQFGQFTAKQAFDGNNITSWVEAADGTGVGEMILFEVPAGQDYIEIIPGYGDPRVFEINNRVRRAELTLYSAQYNWQTNWNDSLVLLRKINTQSLEFKNINEFQRFPLGAASTPMPPYNTVLGLLTIKEVYAGRDEDLSIAEVRFQGHAFRNYTVPFFWNSAPTVRNDTSKYVFYPDGFFSFEPGPMSTAGPTFAGTWEIKGNDLLLNTTSKAAEKQKYPEKRQLPLGTIFVDNENRKYSIFFDEAQWWALPDPYRVISEEPYLDTPVFLIWSASTTPYLLTHDGTVLPYPDPIADKVIDKSYYYLNASDGRFMIYFLDAWDGAEIGFIRGHTSDILLKGGEYRLHGISPDDEALLFSIKRESHSDLCVMDISAESREERRYDIIIEWDGGPQDAAYWVSDREVLISQYRDNATQLISVDVRSQESRIIKPIDEPERVRYISPNGRLISFENDRAVGFFDVSTQRGTRFPESLNIGYQFSWSPEGDKFAYFQRLDYPESSLVVVDVEFFNIKTIRTFDGGYPFDLGWFDNGHYAFTIGSMFEEGTPHGIFIADVETGEVETVSEEDFYGYPAYMACPHLFIYDGERYSEIGEIMGLNIGKWSERSDLVAIAPEFTQETKLKIRINEFLDEITYLNSVSIIVDDKRIFANNSPASLSVNDNEYITLQKGDSIDLEFDLPLTASADGVVLDSVGYYEPLAER